MIKIAVVGLGNMGVALVEGLLAARHDVTVWNRTATKAGSLIEKGAHLAASATEAIAGVQASFVVLLDGEGTGALQHGPDI